MYNSMFGFGERLAETKQVSEAEHEENMGNYGFRGKAVKGQKASREGNMNTWQCQKRSFSKPICIHYKVLLSNSISEF